MKERPTLDTVRLRLRPFTLADAPDVQRLAGERAIADTTANIPHPYLDGMAEQWITTHQGRFEAGELVNVAITRRDGNILIGAIGLMVFDAVRAQTRTAGLLSDEHFTVDGTQLEAWASLKSFQRADAAPGEPPDDPGNPNGQLPRRVATE